MQLALAVGQGQGAVRALVGDDPGYPVRLVQSGLGMPTRDYYLEQDPKSAEARANGTAGKR